MTRIVAGHVWTRRSDPQRRRARRASLVLVTIPAIVLGCAGLVAGAGTAQAGALRVQASREWKVQPTPNGSTVGAAVNELSAVSCSSQSRCTAVGSDSASLSSPSFALAERWNGTRWRIQAAARPRGAERTAFSGVSCSSAVACTAVGYVADSKKGRAVNLAESWDGTSWRVETVPTPKISVGGKLTAVSCSEAGACTAVGFYDKRGGRPFAFAVSWNGKTWSVDKVPNSGKTELDAVSCSAAHACTAVGYGSDGPLAEAWNGTSWHVQSVPLPPSSSGGIFEAVSCTSRTDCRATGTSFGSSPTLVERWNGIRWRVQASPNPPGFGGSMEEVALNGISCSSATSCTATGAWAPGGFPAYFLEAWNGESWRLVSAPVPTHFSAGALNAVACPDRTCTAVGAWSGGPIHQSTLSMAD